MDLAESFYRDEGLSWTLHLALWGCYPQGSPNIGPKMGEGFEFGRSERYLTVIISKMVNCSIVCQLGLEIRTTEAFQRCKGRGSCLHRHPCKTEYVAFFTIFSTVNFTAYI